MSVLPYLVVAWLVGIAGTLAVLTLPNRYQSRAQIYVDTRSVLRPLLQGLAVSPQTQDQTDVVRRALLARPDGTFIASGGGNRGALYAFAEDGGRALAPVAERATNQSRAADLAALDAWEGHRASLMRTVSFTSTSLPLEEGHTFERRCTGPLPLPRFLGAFAFDGCLPDAAATASAFCLTGVVTRR